MKMNRKKYISGFAVISFILALLAFVLLQYAKRSAELADFINSTLSMYLRRAFALVSDKVSFSIFELLICLIPAALIIIILLAVRRFKSGEGRLRFILDLLGIVLIIYTLYILTLAIPYRTSRLEDNIGLAEAEVNAESLYETSEILVGEINALKDKLSFENGESKMPYDMDTLSEKLSASYKSISGQYELFPDFESRAKPIRASAVMSSLRLLGIYTFFTGESNINVAYPDFDRPFTVAHEFAHQRGVVREDEANFMAFLVCIGSDDDFIKYSGYLRLYEYIRSALYRTDKELFKLADSKLCAEARSDIMASYAVSEKYENSFLGELSDKLNDFYLKQNGTEGVISYGLVTRLAVAYYQSEGS